MKNKKTLGLAALVGFLATAAAYGAAISAGSKYKLNNDAGQVPFETQLGTLIEESDDVNSASTVQVRVGTHLKRVARAEFDAGKTTLGVIGVGSPTVRTLGVDLPAASLITDSYFEIVRGFTGTTGRLTVRCGPTMGNLTFLSTVNVVASTVGRHYQMWPSTLGRNDVGTAKLNAPCTLAAQVEGGESFTAGKIVLFVEYVVSEQN